MQPATQETSRAVMAAAQTAEAPTKTSGFITCSVTATTVQAFIDEIQEVAKSGVDIIELRLDFLKDFDTERDLKMIMASCPLPYIVTYRPKWEGGNYEGPEPPRLATLKYAALCGAPYVDVEFKAAALFFAGQGEVPIQCKVILSSHNFQKTPPAAELHQLAKDMHAAGADIVKIATMANDIADSAAVLSLLQSPVAPTIALAMGEKGQIVRLLAAKYGGYLTFAALSPDKASAPGQPTVATLKALYNYQNQGPRTKVYGIIGNPVSHSKSPLIHNTAFQHIGHDGVYVPLLVDDLPRFLDAFAGHPDFQGFSVTIPHKEAALKAAKQVDPVAAKIGAVNTLIRQPDGSFKGYNTDWCAAIDAIERQLSSSGTSSSGSGSSGSSPLAGKTFLVLGAGGAGRALAFGAADRGAKVLITNRSRERAEQLAASLPGSSVVAWEDVQAGKVKADVLANSTSLGMAPKDNESPVPAATINNYGLVFDAVYTPVWTQLLLDAKAGGCQVVDGLQMFVGQAVLQFQHFTGKQAPTELMQSTLVNALGLKK
eukprot:CAMPEP_0202872118 /NCGR_PEP_ID=MMETSP1391-20130828/20452_1 /ASSEMBLY_ACC=CAM_ASM_000867 /TAXON_ID=1034604 /ORGANISM="Chlamydomonas leiostraca, Strain SAG 11-49" /LENGTH=542 /DNA_ID=CAMNT_0049553083 /DNA_START=98 /DNA_END=1726 /DNA_ORIENTATION=+